MNVAATPAVTTPAQWPTKGAFVLVALSVGFTGLFRIPIVAYYWGGADFLYPFLACTLLFAIPAFILELALGQVFQATLVQAIQKVHPWFRGLGYYAVLLALTLSACYGLFSSWALFFLTEQTQTQLPYEIRQTYFRSLVDPAETGPRYGAFSGWLLLAFTVQWVGVYVSLWRSVHWLSYAAYVVVPLGFTVILAMTVWSLFLSDASTGLERIFVPHPQLWPTWDLWLTALAQSFLSLGLGTGVVPALGSRNHKSRDVLKWSLVIALGSACFSVTIAVLAFALLGNRQLSDVTEPPNLAIMSDLVFHLFDGLPDVAMVAGRFVVLLTLYFSGSVITWAYALSVTQVVGFHWPNLPDSLVAAGVCIAGLAVSVPFTFGIGYGLLESLNYFIPTFCITTVVAVECVAVGCFFDPTSLRQKVRERAHHGWQRLLDYVTFGCYYSITIMQVRINMMQKSRLSRPIWCTFVKYFVPIVSCVLVVTEVVARLSGQDGLLLPVGPQWPFALVGWLLWLTLPVLLGLFLLARPQEVEELGLWNQRTDMDTPEEAEFELALPNGL